jgi:putative hydrolase of the HAD superfamily
MLKVVFFDAAGTLFAAREPVGHTYARLARRHGVDASDEAVSAGFHRAFSQSGGLAFGPGHPPDELRAMERRWWRALVERSFEGLGRFDDFEAYFTELFAYFADPAHWEVMPEAPAALGRLIKRGLRLGVISNFDYRLYRILDGLGLRKYFQTVTISSEAGYAKPRREIFELALSLNRISAAEAMHVGDSPHMDFAAAAQAGLAAVLLDAGMGPRTELSGRGARTGTLATLDEVTQRLDFA